MVCIEVSDRLLHWSIVAPSFLLRPDRRSPHARRHLAETTAERPIEMRDIAKTSRYR
jgi:hypothetical protein